MAKAAKSEKSRDSYFAKIDQQIASQDFFDRLCAVKTKVNNRPTWWPALEFRSLIDFSETLNKDCNALNDTRRAKAIAALEWRKKTEDSRLMYLIGSECRFVIVANSEPQLVHDFYDEYETIDTVGASCEQVASACKFALKRVEISLPVNDVMTSNKNDAVSQLRFSHGESASIASASKVADDIPGHPGHVPLATKAVS